MTFSSSWMGLRAFVAGQELLVRLARRKKLIDLDFSIAAREMTTMRTTSRVG